MANIPTLNLRVNLDPQMMDALRCGARIAAYWRRRPGTAGARRISALLEKILESFRCGFEPVVCDLDFRAAAETNDYSATLKFRRRVLARFFALRALDRKLRLGAWRE